MNGVSWRTVREFLPDLKTELAARERVSQLGIPFGSLGRLHEFAVSLAAIQGTLDVSLDRCTTIAFCADHGVASKGVSSLPQFVTYTNMKYMAEGLATISIYAKLLGAKFCVVDIGVRGPHYNSTMTCEAKDGIDFYDRRVRNGTGDISVSAAMTEDEVDQALQVGFDIATMYANRTDVFVFGEMGIGNTTACSAIIAGLFDEDPDRVTGLGSGISEETRKLKAAIVDQAVKRVKKVNSRPDPLTCLRELGGLEIAGMVGGMIAAAHYRKPIILDGFISATAFAVASQLVRGISSAVFPGTYSSEVGYAVLSRNFKLEPILNLGMRLGEGTGAILAWPILRAAAEQLTKGVTRSDLVVEFSSGRQ